MKPLTLTILIIVSVLLSTALAFAGDPALTAYNDSFTAYENSKLLMNVTANDTGTNIRVGQITQPENGTVILNDNGTITYTPDTNFYGINTFNYTLIENGLFSEDTGHYYEFVTSSGISWPDANTSANARTFGGLQGYLATIGSSEENTFVASKLQGEGWMGASDAGSEGVWKWVTGPEADTQFWSGLGADQGGSIVGGQYNNWASGEPNDSSGEDYAHFLSGGNWNDYKFDNSNIQGYVVEYGGMPGDSPSFVYGYVTLNVTPIAPTITISSPNITDYNLTNNVSINVTADIPIINWWYNYNGTNTTFTPNISLVLPNTEYNLTIYANATNGLIGNNTVSFNVTYVDDDADGIADIIDTLTGNETTSNESSGITTMNVTVNGSTNLSGSFSGVQNIQFNDGADILINMSHNFSQKSLNLSKIKIVKTNVGMIINMSNQTTDGKTIFVKDPGFVRFCVKDAEISSLDDISSACNETTETDFTTCLGNATGVTLNNLTCTDLGNTLKIENLTHSGAVGTLPTPVEEKTPRRSGGGITVRCGDTVCMPGYGETCGNCPTDCGICPVNESETVNSESKENVNETNESTLQQGNTTNNADVSSKNYLMKENVSLVNESLEEEMKSLFPSTKTSMMWIGFLLVLLLLLLVFFLITKKDHKTKEK